MSFAAASFLDHNISENAMNTANSNLRQIFMGRMKLNFVLKSAIFPGEIFEK